MKRFIFSSIAMVLAATACTESGVIDMPEFYGNAIVFDTYIGKTPVTKAEDCNIEYLKKSGANGGGAQVYAFKCDEGNTNRDYVDYSSAYLDGELIYSSNAWGYNVNGTLEEPYMPTSKDLAVVAYNLKASTAMSNFSSNNLQFDFAVKNALTDQVDLLVTPLTFVSENGGDVTVPLRFYHLLSRVGFKVLATGESDTQIKFSSIRLCGKFATSGRVDMTLATATPSSSGSLPITLTGDRRPAIDPYSTSYVYEYSLLSGSTFSILAKDCAAAAAPIYSGSDADNRFMMLMPGQVGDLEDSKPYIEVKYSLSNGTEQTSTIWLTQDLTEAGENWNFQPGYAYEFILKLSTSTIKFSAEIVEGGWDTDLNENGKDDDNINL